MSFREIQCSMCGQRFDPDRHIGCQSCPMHSGCNLVCCPACGYQTVDPGRSKLGRLVRSLVAPRTSTRYSSPGEEIITLTDIPPGTAAKVVGFSEDLSHKRRAYLQAYGLVPNYLVKVVQHSPVTIVRLDHIELALENDLARGIHVQRISINSQDKSID